MSEGWTPTSWRARPALQMPDYPDCRALRSVEDRLARAGPVVAIDDCLSLRRQLAEPRRLLLQGGDCAESFDDAVGERVAALSALFDAMLSRLRPALAAEPIAVARIAGQFAKPRSSPLEDGLPAYRGDIVNGAARNAAARVPDPARMLRAHLQSVGTAASLGAARCGASPIFTSHEALLLPYEQALTRRGDDGRWWATSGHFLWLGDRTRQADGAHADYLSGIANALGVKCGPMMTGDDFKALNDKLDPDREPGRLTWIGRFGAERIGERLPPLLRAMRDEGMTARWAIDPMHGNTHRHGPRKVRRLDDIIAELDQFLDICAAEDVDFGGVHLEMSALDVTECLGGSGPASLDELEANWQSACDPRLNRAQALDLAAHLAERLAPFGVAGRGA